MYSVSGVTTSPVCVCCCLQLQSPTSAGDKLVAAVVLPCLLILLVELHAAQNDCASGATGAGLQTICALPAISANVLALLCFQGCSGKLKPAASLPECAPPPHPPSPSQQNLRPPAVQPMMHHGQVQEIPALSPQSYSKLSEILLKWLILVQV